MGNKEMDSSVGQLTYHQKLQFYQDINTQTIIDRGTQTRLKQKHIQLSHEHTYNILAQSCKKRLEISTEYLVNLKYYELTNNNNNFCGTVRKIDLYYEIIKGETILTNLIKQYETKKYTDGRKIFSENQLQQMLCQLALGLKQFYDFGYYFYNFNTDNITYSPGHKFQVIDPWISPQLSYTRYQSPEQKLFEKDQIYGYCHFQSSLFSLGLIILELADILPHKNCHYHQICKKIDNIKKNSFRQKLMLLLHLSPEKRTKIYNVLENYSQCADKIKQKQDKYKLTSQCKQQKLNVENLSLQLKLANKKQRLNKHNHKYSEKQHHKINLIRQPLAANIAQSKIHNQKVKLNPEKKQSNNTNMVRLINKTENRTAEKQNSFVFQSKKDRLKSSESYEKNKVIKLNKTGALNLRKDIAQFKNSEKPVRSNSHREYSQKQGNLEFVHSTQSSRHSSQKYLHYQITQNQILMEQRPKVSKSDAKSPKQSDKVVTAQNKMLQKFNQSEQLYNQEDNHEHLSLSDYSMTGFNTQKSLIEQLSSLKGLSFKTAQNVVQNREIYSSHSLKLQDNENQKEALKQIVKPTDYDISEVQIGYPLKQIRFKANIPKSIIGEQQYLSRSSQCLEPYYQQKVPKGWSMSLSQKQHVLYFQNGFKYVGQCSGGAPNGHGMLFYPNSKRAYEGNWQNGYSHGQGIQYPLTVDDQDKISVNDNYKKLLCSIPDKESIFWIKFSGVFSHGKRNGKGILIMKNGDIFKGNWLNDNVEGEGRYFKVNGEIIQGKWIKNILITKK